MTVPQVPPPGFEIRPVVGVGDSWLFRSRQFIEACIGAPLAFEFSQGFSPVSLWLSQAKRIKHLIGSGNTVFLSTGGSDEINWVLEGQHILSQYHPRRVARRLHQLTRILIGQNENIVLHAGYAATELSAIPEAFFDWVPPGPSAAGKIYRHLDFDGVPVEFGVDPFDPLHLDDASYQRRIESITWPVRPIIEGV